MKGDYITYPDDFIATDGSTINSEVTMYRCPSAGKRVIISNGMPNHDITINPSTREPCEYNIAAEMPLFPSVQGTQTEVPVRGTIAIAINGVPGFGPQESTDANAVEPGDGTVQVCFHESVMLHSHISHYFIITSYI